MSKEISILLDEIAEKDKRIAELEAAAKPKAKRLVWEEESQVHIAGSGKVSFIATKEELLVQYPEGRKSCNKYRSVDEAKQSAQEWYDNYVSEFIKENCELVIVINI